jgi:hypothetical protein
MMTLKEINKRIQRSQPDVELVRGEGYHYYVFDNSAEGDKTTGRDGQTLVFETESVMQMYLSHSSAERWIEDGIEFGENIRAKYEIV